MNIKSAIKTQTASDAYGVRYQRVTVAASPRSERIHPHSHIIRRIGPRVVDMKRQDRAMKRLIVEGGAA